MRTTVYGIAAWAVLVVTVQAADCRDLHVKNVFSGEFPQVLDFRGENSHDNPNYQAYSEELRLMDGSLKKLVPEEIDRIGPEFAQWANRYAREHPEILMLLHLDGQARQTHDHPEVQKRYFPGHWVYQPGALLTADADATSLCAPRQRHGSLQGQGLSRSSHGRVASPRCAPGTNGSGGKPLVVRFGIRLRPRG